MFRQISYIRKADIVVLDSYCIPVSMFHFKNKPIVIQMWHAVGLMKKSGYSITNMEEGGRGALVAKVMKMHKGYDYVFASSKACVPSIAEMFGYPEGKVVHQVLPRIDLLFDDGRIERTRRVIFEKYPQLANGKKNILYAPTWRARNEEFVKNVRALEREVDFENYNLIIKFHPISLHDKQVDSMVFVDAVRINEYNAADLALVSDVCVTDYSSVLYEFLLMGKPTYSYAFDIDGYDKNRGFYVDYVNEIPGGSKRTASELVAAIRDHRFDYEGGMSFASKYVDVPEQGCVESIVRFLEGCVDDERAKRVISQLS